MQEKSYHVSPARRWIMVWVFAPFLLVCAAILFSDQPGAGVALMLIVLPIAGFGHWMISYARLILSPEKIVWRQLGCRMETTWDNIEAVRLDRGREGFLSKEPLSGPGVKRMAAARGTGMRGIPLYDEQQREALAEGVLMPLDPFAYAIRDGSLLADIERWAPDVAARIRTELDRVAQCEAERKKVPLPPKERRGRWIVGGLIIGALALGIGSASMGPNVAGQVTHAISALAVAVFALSSLHRCWHAFRRRAWSRALFLLLTIVLSLWSIAAWSEVMGGM